MNENAKRSIGIARMHADELAKLGARKVAFAPIEDVVRELSEVVYHGFEALLLQLPDDSEKAQSDSKKAA